MADTKYISLEGVQIAYVEKIGGKSETIVFSPSMLFDKRMFVHQISSLPDQYNVIAYDHRGHGESSKATNGRYDADAYFDDASAFIETLDVGPVHFCGNSLGGFVALRLAARRPDLVKTAIAMGSSGDRETNREQFTQTIEVADSGGLAPLADGLAGAFFGKTSLEDPAFASTRQFWADYFRAQDSFAAELMRGVVFRTGINSELKHSRVPVLAIAGAEDSIYGPAQSQAIAAASRGTFVSIERAGHSVALEQPKSVNTEISAFIQRAVSSGQ